MMYCIFTLFDVNLKILDIIHQPLNFLNILITNNIRDKNVCVHFFPFYQAEEPLSMGPYPRTLNGMHPIVPYNTNFSRIFLKKGLQNGGKGAIISLYV